MLRPALIRFASLIAGGLLLFSIIGLAAAHAADPCAPPSEECIDVLSLAAGLAACACAVTFGALAIGPRTRSRLPGFLPLASTAVLGAAFFLLVPQSSPCGLTFSGDMPHCVGAWWFIAPATVGSALGTLVLLDPAPRGSTLAAGLAVASLTLGIAVLLKGARGQAVAPTFGLGSIILGILLLLPRAFVFFRTIKRP